MNQNLSHPPLLRFPHQLSLTISATLLVFLNACPSARAQGITPIPDVSVNAPLNAVPAEGSEAAGYKPSTVSNFGPLGQKKIEDVPYSVNVISSDLIENVQAGTADDVYRISPVVQQWTAGGRDGNAPNIILRGFTQANASARAEDGMRVQYMEPVSLEDKERIEIYTGLTSFLYGPANVGGLINYVYKRPTSTPLANVTIGDYGNLAGFVHGDFGGPIDKDGRFAYRLNIVGQDGNVGVDHQNNQRALISAALDWHISETATLEFLAKHDYLDIQGLAPAWVFLTNTNGSLKAPIPAAPNGSNYYGQPWNHERVWTDRIGTDFNWKLNDIFTLRTSYAFLNTYLPSYSSAANIVSDTSGTYSQFDHALFGQRYQTSTGYGFLDSSFDTWKIHHNLTVGYFGNISTLQYAAGTIGNVTINGNFYNPTYIPQDNFPTTGGTRATSNITYMDNFVVGDEIKFTDFVSVLAGGTYSKIHDANFDTTAGPTLGNVTSEYDAAKPTPSVSLVVKPLPWFTTYATYSESLEEGQSVPSTGSIVYTNAGQVLPPFTSKEYEVGAKVTVGGLLLTAALFDINKALQFAVTNPDGTQTYVQDGREIHKGVELTATGNVIEGWRVMGGLTLLDPRISQYQANPALDGNAPQYVSKQFAKLTTEYDLPFARGLTLTGGIYYNGKSAADVTNTYYFPAYTTADIGLRYRTKLPSGQEIVFRIEGKNITDTHYWLPAGYTGAPRTVAMSTEVKF